MKKYNSDSLVYMKCINLLLMASGKRKYTSDPVVVCNQFSLQDVVKKTQGDHSLSAFCSPCEVRGQGRSLLIPGVTDLVLEDVREVRGSDGAVRTLHRRSSSAARLFVRWVIGHKLQALTNWWGSCCSHRRRVSDFDLSCSVTSNRSDADFSEKSGFCLIVNIRKSQHD